jgi:lipopolysaccharide biosynthesis glycosyltransferase
MKNLVYMTVFRNAGYIDLLALLLKSMKLKGCLNNETTDILLITHPSMNDAMGEKVVPLDFRLNLWYLDLHELIDAARSRLFIFDYPFIDKYDKILYLDTDILINSDINKILDIPIEKDILYVGPEMTLASEYHGGWFYGNNYPSVHMSQPAFSSGILFFRNSQKVKDMFHATNALIHDEIKVKKNEPPPCLDQPFLVFNAAIRHMYNTTTINHFISGGRCPEFVNENIIIYHFAGDIGYPVSKKEWMDAFIQKIIDFKPSTVSS